MVQKHFKHKIGQNNFHATELIAMYSNNIYMMPNQGFKSNDILVGYNNNTVVMSKAVQSV